MSVLGIVILAVLPIAFVASSYQYRKARVSEEVELFPWLAPTSRDREPQTHALYVKLRYGTPVIAFALMIVLLAVTGSWRDVLFGWK
jgi:hypothetical protein